MGMKKIFYILYVIGNYSLCMDYNDQTIPSLRTLAAQMYTTHNNNPYEFSKKKIPDDCQNLLAQAWCNNNPEKVPHYVYQCNTLSEQASKQTILWGDCDTLLMADNNNFTIFDICSDTVIKKIPLDQGFHNNYAQLSTTMIATAHKDNKIIKLYDIKHDTESLNAYNHSFSLVPLFLDEKNIMLTEYNFPNIAYFCYQLEPWQEKYVIDTQTFVKNTCCAVGIANNTFIVNNPPLGIHIFDLNDGRLQEILPESSRIKSALLSGDKTIVGGYQTQEGSLDALTLWNLVTKKKSVAHYLQSPFFLTDNKVFYYTNNEVLDLQKNVFYKPYYIASKKIKDKLFIPQKVCNAHNIMLLTTNNVSPEFFVTNNNEPSTLHELLGALDVASLLEQTTTLTTAQQRINELEEQLQNLPHDSDKKSIAQILHSLTDNY